MILVLFFFIYDTVIFHLENDIHRNNSLFKFNLFLPEIS